MKRGSGSIFHRGGSLWIKWYRDGQPVRESVARALDTAPAEVTERDAQTLLNKRLGAVAAGQPIVLKADRVRVADLLDDLVVDYEVNGRRSIRRMKAAIAHLREALDPTRAESLDTARIRTYTRDRQAAGASNATVNRELAALKRAYTLGMQARRIQLLPYIPMLRENNARQGFFERDQFEAVIRHLPEPVRPVAAFAFVTGWRVSEVLGLTWDCVDFDAQMVRLEPGSTKNYEGRQFPFTPDLFAILDAQRETTKAASVRLERIIPTVFHRDGAPIKSFRHSWDSACKAAGVPGRIFHDFRRTAVRNLERAGVSRSVAMKLTGHKTEAVYRRYAIVSDSDLRAAAVKLAAASDQPRAPRIAALHSV
jgi:integrase